MPANGRRNAAPPPEIASETLVYGRAEGRALRAECHRAADASARRGRAVVLIHGGAWSASDRHAPAVLARRLAAGGFTAVSLDFRDGRDGSHPCAVRDIAAGVRYVRANAEALAVDAGRIGLMGSSSGGHLALWAALRPDVDQHQGTLIRREGASGAAEFWDPDISAAVQCVVALWPVADPLARFEYARRAGRNDLAAAHLRYFRDEAHMRSASVPRVLRDGEAEALPPLLLVQPGADANVPREMTLALLCEYQDAGGVVHYLFYPGLPHAFAYQASAETAQLARQAGWFLDQHLA